MDFPGNAPHLSNKCSWGVVLTGVFGSSASSQTPPSLASSLFHSRSWDWPCPPSLTRGPQSLDHWGSAFCYAIAFPWAPASASGVRAFFTRLLPAECTVPAVPLCTWEFWGQGCLLSRSWQQACYGGVRCGPAGRQQHSGGESVLSSQFCCKPTSALRWACAR